MTDPEGGPDHEVGPVLYEITCYIPGLPKEHPRVYVPTVVVNTDNRMFPPAEMVISDPVAGWHLGNEVLPPLPAWYCLLRWWNRWFNQLKLIMGRRTQK